MVSDKKRPHLGRLAHPMSTVRVRGVKRQDKKPRTPPRLPLMDAAILKESGSPFPHEVEREKIKEHPFGCPIRPTTYGYGFGRLLGVLY